jgi:pimeloyl-ACP methyl ester carboxylesterase
MTLEELYGKKIKRIELLGHSCAYIDEGSGTPVIFLHGYSVNLACFSPVYPLFRKNRRIIGLDYPGYYLSEKRRDVSYDIPFMADAVVSLIEKLRLKNVVIVGSSMGGAVAMEAALKKPKAISALVLAAPVGFSGRNPFLGFMVFLQTKVLPFEKQREKMYARLFSRVDTFFAEKTHPFRKTIEEGYRQMKSADDFDLWIRTLLLMAQSVLTADYRKRAAKIETPAYIIWGERDEVLPPKGAGIAQNSMGGNLTVEMVPGKGHLPFVEAPERFYMMTDTYLKALGT